MGWWGHDIMAGDGPADLRVIFEERFPTAPDPSELVAFATKYIQEWNDPATVPQVVGYLVMQHGYTMPSDLHAMILEGIARDESDDWTSPAIRRAVLRAFSINVTQYFTNGSTWDAPFQGSLHGVEAGGDTPLASCILVHCSETSRMVVVTRAEAPELTGLPGGSVDPGETPYSAAVREFKEEVGDVAPIIPLFSIFLDMCDTHLNYTYCARVDAEREVVLTSPEAHRGIIAQWMDIPTFLETTKYKAYNLGALEFFGII